MARETTLLYSATSTAGGNLDSGVLKTGQYDQLFVALEGASATSGACTLWNTDSTGTADVAAMATVASVAASAVSYALSCGTGVGAVGSALPVPPYGAQVKVTGATTSVVTCNVWGIRFL